MRVPYESLVNDSNGFSSMNLDNVWSMFPDAYCVSFPCASRCNQRSTEDTYTVC